MDPADDGREIALTDHSVAMLIAMGAWDTIPASEIAPLLRMQVLNGPSDYTMQLGHSGTDSGMLGRFVPNHWLRRSLYAVVQGLPGVIVLPSLSVAAVRAQGSGITATLSDGPGAHGVLGRRGRHSTVAAASAARHRSGAARLPATDAGLPGRASRPAPRDGHGLVRVWPDPGDAALERRPVFCRADGRRGRRDRLAKHERRGVRPRADPALPWPAGCHAAGRRSSCRAGGDGLCRPFRRPALRPDGGRCSRHAPDAPRFNFGMLGQQALARELRASVAAGRDVADPAALARYEATHRAETGLFFTGAEALMRLYAAGNSLPARLLRSGALRLGNLPPLRNILTARMRDPDKSLIETPGRSR